MYIIHKYKNEIYKYVKKIVQKAEYNAKMSMIAERADEIFNK